MRTTFNSVLNSPGSWHPAVTSRTRRGLLQVRCRKSNQELLFFFNYTKPLRGHTEARMRSLHKSWKKLKCKKKSFSVLQLISEAPLSPVWAKNFLFFLVIFSCFFVFILMLYATSKRFTLYRFLKTCRLIFVVKYEGREQHLKIRYRWSTTKIIGPEVNLIFVFLFIIYLFIIRGVFYFGKD